MIGESRIESLDDPDVKAQICKTEVETSLTALLTMTRWNFNYTRVLLAADAAPIPPGFTYQYSKPGDCLRVWGIGDDLEGNPDDYLIWKEEGLKIRTNEAPPLLLHYARDLPDPTQWLPAFLLAVKYHWASALAAAIPHDTRMSQGFASLYRNEMDNAMAIDGQTGTQATIRADDLILVRDG